MIRHFLDFSEIDAAEIRKIIACAGWLKQDRKAGRFSAQLANKKLAMIFEKNSTRTRVSFEVAMLELGGQAIALNGNDLQLGRGESISDTAKVISRYVDVMMLRCHSHEKLQELAKNSSVPVINGLTEFSHPCQILADILTFEENMGSLVGKTIAWVGDGNNVAHSWIQAATLLGCNFRIACPTSLAPLPKVVEWARARGGNIVITTSPEEAVAGANAVITDTWVSMGDPDADAKISLLKPYQVNAEIMKKATPDAIFMHCLPAHRGEEVTADVIDGGQSKVFDEAENRLHAQKAVLLWCLGIL